MCEEWSEDCFLTPNSPFRINWLYLQLLVTPEVSELSLKDTILNIKSAGNFRVKEIIPYLKRFIYGSQIHYVRSTAAWNLIAVARDFPEEVREVVAPIFFNQLEEQDLRIASLLSWLYSGPPKTQLILIGKHLLKEETNRQIVNYAYSTLEQFSKLKFPCFRRL